MAHYYKTVDDFEAAEQLVSQLQQAGIDKNHVNIIIAQEDNINAKNSTLQDTNITIKDAPEGTVNAFGAVFAPIMGVAGGLAFLVAGPIAAMVAGAAVASGGITLLLSGIGVPEDKHEELINQLGSGQVLVHVEADNNEISRFMTEY